MAEELGAQEGLVESGAVDGDERAAAARPELVQVEGGELLATAGLTGEQHREVGRRDLHDALLERHYGGRLALDVGEIGLAEVLH